MGGGDWVERVIDWKEPLSGGVARGKNHRKLYFTAHDIRLESSYLSSSLTGKSSVKRFSSSLPHLYKITSYPSLYLVLFVQTI